jgi:hypothetical protein
MAKYAMSMILTSVEDVEPHDDVLSLMEMVCLCIPPSLSLASLARSLSPSLSPSLWHCPVSAPFRFRSLYYISVSAHWIDTRAPLQALRFAFKCHQFAGGFDAEATESFISLSTALKGTQEALP